MENILPQNVHGSNYQLLAVMLMKLPNGQIPVEVDHSQLRTMASETVYPIDWMLASTRLRAVTPELHVLHGANAGYKSQDLLQLVRREHASFGMPGQRSACAPTQGINEEYNCVVI